MENKVIEVIDALCDKFGIAVDWTSQNVFPYMQDLMNRIVKYEIITSIFWVVFFCSVCISSFIFMKKVCKTEGVSDECAGITGFLFFVLLIATIIAVPMQFHDIVEALTIPEKTFIDMISTYGG